MSEQLSNTEQLARLYETFESGGAGAAAPLIEEIFDPDLEFNPLETGDVGGRTYRGREGMLAFFGELHAAFEEVRYEPPQLYPVGDELVVALTRLAGIARETGLPLQQDLSLVYEFSGGRVRCVTAYDTPADALEAAERGHADA